MAENLLALKKRAVKAGMDKAEARKAGRDTLLKFLSNGAGSKSASKKATKKAVAKKKGGSSTKASKKGSTKKSSTKRKTSNNGKAGRISIGKLKFSGFDPDDWKPREDSVTGIIFKALKQNKGDVDATYKALKGQLSKLVPPKTRGGRKRTKDEQKSDLKYRINRTKWDFALRTGQHSAATNRVEYGSGSHAEATKKAARKAKANSKKKAKAGGKKKGKR
jgi:hypothetical protein